MADIAAKKIKSLKPLAALTPKHEEVLGLLVHGIEHRDSRINGGDHPVGQPLSVNQVADLLKVRRAYVRDLMSDALFKTKYNQAVADRRGAVGPRALAALESMLEPQVVPQAHMKAAFAKAIEEANGSGESGSIEAFQAMLDNRVTAKASDTIAAAKVLLGEDAKGFSVNVQVNNQTNIANAIRPGYVLDLGAMHGRRHDDAPIIEGKAE